MPKIKEKVNFHKVLEDRKLKPRLVKEIRHDQILEDLVDELKLDKDDRKDHPDVKDFDKVKELDWDALSAADKWQWTFKILKASVGQKLK